MKAIDFDLRIIRNEDYSLSFDGNKLYFSHQGYVIEIEDGLDEINELVEKIKNRNRSLEDIKK